MVDKFLLAPYYWTLRLRHRLYDKGILKSSSSPVPTICVGNITVGGTGKTPHTEMLIRILQEIPSWKGKHIAVLSRGYKRKSKGFLIVEADGTADRYGDEPLQIKRKFPEITVAVDKDRNHGCEMLSRQSTGSKGNRTPAADIIILDDAFQHRAIKAGVSIVLIDCGRPVFNDHLIPVGRLRDLPERIDAADIIIVTKCPKDMNGWQKSTWAEALGLDNYDAASCSGTAADGKTRHLFFTTISYCAPEAVFPEGDYRYLYSKRLILFSGIANDSPLVSYLRDTYKIVSHFNFPDHHKFTRGDIRTIRNAAEEFPTSVIMTTEKDSQRMRDARNVPDILKQRMFYAPIKTGFLCSRDHAAFTALLKEKLL